jgi:hypothetical protein
METISLVWIEPGGVFLLLGLPLPEGRTNPDKEGGRVELFEESVLDITGPGTGIGIESYPPGQASRRRSYVRRSDIPAIGSNRVRTIVLLRLCTYCSRPDPRNTRTYVRRVQPPCRETSRPFALAA